METEKSIDHEDDEARHEPAHEPAHEHHFTIGEFVCKCTCGVWLGKSEAQAIVNGADRQEVIRLAERRNKRGKR